MKKFIYLTIVIIVLNYLVTSFIGWCYNPSLSQMEVFLNIPQYFLWNFN